MTKKRGRPRSSTDTPAETTLFCLVNGEPLSSFFSVTVGNHENLDGLRKLIKKENEPDFNKFARRKLKLWIVDIPFNSPNLSNSSVNIANVLQGQEFLPPNKVGDIFTTQPNEDNIHIIVELPNLASKWKENLTDNYLW